MRRVRKTPGRGEDATDARWYSTVRVDLAPFCVLQILFSEIGQELIV